MKQHEKRKQLYKSLEAKSLRTRSLLTRMSDGLTMVTGTPFFLIANMFLFIGWISINLNFIPGIAPFDPFPFGLLTMIVSLEAIILAICVLISQNRSAYISSMREEVALRVDLIAEEEITKILQVLAEIRKKVGIETPDPELKEMLEWTDANYIEQSITDQVNRANKPIMDHIKKEVPEMMKSMIKPIEIAHEVMSPEIDKKPA